MIIVRLRAADQPISFVLSEIDSGRFFEALLLPPVWPIILRGRDCALRLLVVCCASDLHAAVGIPEELLFYRQRAGSAVRNSDIALQTEWGMMSRHLEHPLVPTRIRRRGYSFLAFKMAVISALARRDWKTALKWYVKAVRLCPVNMNLYVLPLRKLAMRFCKKEELVWLRSFWVRAKAAEPTLKN